ncbi:MAG: protease inhibitor I42 family protein [Acidobacteriaceae bacterium]
MFKLLHYLSVLALVCLLLTACEQTGQSTSGKTVIVTPAIEGNSAILNVGDTLELHIPTIPTAGYEWEVQGLDTNILLQEGSAVYTADTDANAAGGIVSLRFTAIAAGNTSLNLLYVNSPSDGSPAMSSKSFGMAVEVK